MCTHFLSLCIWTLTTGCAWRQLLGARVFGMCSEPLTNSVFALWRDMDPVCNKPVLVAKASPCANYSPAHLSFYRRQ